MFLLSLIILVGMVGLVSAIEYNEITISNSELEQGKTLDIEKNDKLIFEIDGTEYYTIIESVGDTSYSKEGENLGRFGLIQVKVSENNKIYISHLPPDDWDPVSDEEKFELNYDIYYDILIKLEEGSIEDYSNGLATITIKKIHEKIPDGSKMIYTCAKFYNCPNGERVRYAEIKGTGCSSVGNPFSLCEEFIERERESCYFFYYLLFCCL